MQKRRVVVRSAVYQDGAINIYQDVGYVKSAVFAESKAHYEEQAASWMQGGDLEAFVVYALPEVPCSGYEEECRKNRRCDI